MRDTSYATELASASLESGDGELRVERLRIKSSGVDEIRFSWWNSGKLAPRPLDLPEPQLLELLRRGIAAAVFTREFVDGLRGLPEPPDSVS